MTPLESHPCVLALNGGSSSIRFAIYPVRPPLSPMVYGKVARIGVRGTILELSEPNVPTRTFPLGASGHAAVVRTLLSRLESLPQFGAIAAVGHRVVHGMAHAEPERITARLLAELRRITPFAPDHLPRELALIDAVASRHPRLPQVACFDTAFHSTMPRVATLLSIPRRLASREVHRYGFHGLSYAYLMEELGRLDLKGSRGRVVLAHLGNGASLAAVHRGRSVDTTMGFTPAGGLVMGTRSGDLDPGLVYYLAHERHMTAARFRTMVNDESGLLGVSGISSDVRDLLERESSDARAADAIALFCYQVTKGIGAFAAALGGVDTLVFSGGIGEHSAIIRARICAGLAFLGIAVNPARNAGHAPLISPDTGRVRVRVIPTDEERMIATAVVRMLRRPATGDRAARSTPTAARPRREQN